MISPPLMMTVRQIHTYIGAFIAPSVLFFAFTGSLQLFSLHEAHGAYTPPAIIEALGHVHTDQILKEKPDPASKSADTHEDHDHDHHAAGPPAWPVKALKWVFLTMAIGLITSTLLGLWLAFTSARRKGVVLALFVAGGLLPLVLLLA
jgi:hypothetical protein